MQETEDLIYQNKDEKFLEDSCSRGLENSQYRDVQVDRGLPGGVLQG